jgi:hypothetical protein
MATLEFRLQAARFASAMLEAPPEGGTPAKRLRTLCFTVFAFEASQILCSTSHQALSG